MKRAGEVFSIFFDERLIQKAEGYSRLFDYWITVAQKHGIAAAADHSRIKELDGGILLVEADHPGWIQILQTKENRILDDFRHHFPDMDISGISLMLNRGGSPVSVPTDNVEPVMDEKTVPDEVKPVKETNKHSTETAAGYDSIKDEGLKETLRRLEQSIATKERTQ